MGRSPFLRLVQCGRKGRSIFLVLQQGTHAGEIVIEIIRRGVWVAELPPVSAACRSDFWCQHFAALCKMTELAH
jgi:hypothetical protein